MKLSATILVFFAGLCLSAEGAKILGIFQVPTQSHQIIGQTLLQGLAAKGHDVTIATPFPVKDKGPKLRHIPLEGLVEIGSTVRQLLATMSNSSQVEVFWQVGNFTNFLADTTVRNPSMLKLANSGEKFDIVIFESFNNEAFFGYSHLFDAHTVILSTGSSMAVNPLAGNVAPYAFVPSTMATYTDHMTFVERCLNSLGNLLYDVYINVLTLPAQKKLYEEMFPNAPQFEKIITSSSLHLINAHVIFESPRPYLPNMIQISGLHIKEPQTLPKDLQDYLDSAKGGAILFSLGSNLHSKDLPDSSKESILKAFSKLSQYKFLWKFEDENLAGIPNNVKISKWLPQSDILAHPNIKLFITHGGMLSSTEAVYRGVPILGIPFYGDQHANTEMFVNHGYGEKILFEDITEETLSDKIKQIVGDLSYRERLQKASAIYKDQETKPLDRAIYWIEHVVKHNGAKYLRSGSLDLSLPQYLLLDVLAFALLVVGIFVAGIVLSCKTLCKWCKKSKGEKKDSYQKRKSKRK